MKKVFIFFTALISLVFISTTSANAQTTDSYLATYEFTRNTTKLVANSRWHNGIAAYNAQNPYNKISPYIRDFTSICNLKIISSDEVHIEIGYPTLRTYDYYDFGDGYQDKSVGLYEFGQLDDLYKSFVYEGNTSYGDLNHRTGVKVQPFFLFLDESQNAYAPYQFKKNATTGNYVAKFAIDLPLYSFFTIGISFSTVYQTYESGSYTYYFNCISSSDVIHSDFLHL